MEFYQKGGKCVEKSKSIDLGQFSTLEGDSISKWVEDPVIDDNKKFAALCAETAKKTKYCNYFMYNYLYPSKGCQCCESV